MQHALRRLLGEAGRADDMPAFHLFSATARILPTHNRRVGAKFMRVLRERGVQVHAGARVCEVTPGAVRIEGGETCAVDEVIWATEAGAPAWPAAAGLAVDGDGFIAVADTLESTSHPGVFAAGDVAAVVNHPREKAGVFAVRQGRPLHANLRRAVRGEPLAPFRPQRAFLSLITTGDRYAVASRGAWSVEGRWVWSGRTGSTGASCTASAACRTCRRRTRPTPSWRGWRRPSRCRSSPAPACAARGADRRWARQSSTACCRGCRHISAATSSPGWTRSTTPRSSRCPTGCSPCAPSTRFRRSWTIRTCSGGSRRTTAWATSMPWGRSRARPWRSSPFRSVPRRRRKRCCGTCSRASSRRCARRRPRSSADIPPKAPS